MKERQEETHPSGAQSAGSAIATLRRKLNLFF
jgi:hypothetical protein